MNTNTLVAILAGLISGNVNPRLLPTESRTVKIRPANYTHPMIVSSPAEIAAWNRDVVNKKRAKLTAKIQRYAKRREAYSIGLKTA
jgi:hypothetical protein